MQLLQLLDINTHLNKNFFKNCTGEVQIELGPHRQEHWASFLLDYNQ
jgi:hypothetical protein